MQFDAKNIAPLFKLEMGLPGNSFAFEMARKMGLPEAIIKDAEERAGDEYVGIERNLRKIARNRRALDEKLEKIRHTDKTLENITGRYQKELEDIKKTRKEIIDEARREAEGMVKEANKRIERTIREIKENQAEKEKTQEVRRELGDFMSLLTQGKQRQQKNREDYVEGKLRQLSERREREKARRVRRGTAAPEEAPAESAADARSGPLKVGEKVRVKDNGMVGEVSKVSAKAVTVIIGSITSKLPHERVERISSNEYKEAVRNIPTATRPLQVEDAAIRERKLAFKPELDVRGERLGDALEIVMRFVDDAIMLGMPSVRIVHGKGTGVLHEEIQKMLRATAGVASVKDEHIQHGGSGVTIVTFD